MNFDKFKGIRKERKITARQSENPNLCALLAVRDKCIDFLVQNYVLADVYNSDVADDFTPLKKAYSALEKEFMKCISFTQNDLRDFILINANSGEDSKYQENLGLYTGFLLHLLTERSKGLRFCIDGGGSQFDYLFFGANTIDELIVSNFIGEYICRDIGSRGGKARLIALSNIKGPFIGSDIGCYSGKVSRVICTDINGDNALSLIGRNEGHVKQVIVARAKGDRILGNCADDGRINQIVGVHLEGKEILYEATGNYEGRIDQVICADLKGENAFNWMGNEGEVIQLMYDDVLSVGEYCGAQNISCGGEIIAASAYSFSPSKIKRALKFAKEIGDKSCQEIIGLADKMYKFRPLGDELE